MEPRRIYRKSSIGIAIAAAASALLSRGWQFPLGVLAGGALGMLNLRGMVKGLEDIGRVPDPKARIMVKSLVRLSLVFAAIILLAVTRAVNLAGLAVGFSVVLLMVISEGFLHAKRGAP